jgi:SulP family sulfate permease
LFGLALVIIIRQAAVMAGVQTGTGDVFVRGWDIARRHGDWNIPSLATGFACLIALLGLETWAPKLPAAIGVLVLSALAYAGLHLGRHGVQHVVDVHAGLPRLALPDVSAGRWLALVPTAAGLALIVFVLGHGVAERLLGPDDRPSDANREMAGLGLANLLAGVFGGAAVSGSPSASSAAHSTGGGRTYALPTVSAGLLLVVAVALTRGFALLPEPALAAVVIMAVRPFLALGTLRHYLHDDRRSLAVFVWAVLGVVTFTLIPGLLIAVIGSLLIFVADASRLRVSELGRTTDGGAYLAFERHADLVRPNGVTILRPDGQLFFANVGRLATAVDAELARPEHAGYPLVLDLSASFELRSAVVDALVTIRRRVQAQGRSLRLAHLYLGVLDAISSGPLADLPAFQTLDEAVRRG